MIEIIKKLGLTEKEAAVYLAGLELGPASVKALSIKSKVKRTTIYPILEDLKQRGLFTETLKKKKHIFAAAHPNKLKVMLNDQQLLLERNFDDLLSRVNTVTGRPTVQYYDSVEGVHKMYEDSLQGAQNDTVGIAGEDAVELLDEKWLLKYINKRKRKGIGAKTILTKGKDSAKWKKSDQDQNRETRFLVDEGEVPINIEVVGDRVLISSLKGEVLGMVIESKRVAKAMETILNNVWENSEE